MSDQTDKRDDSTLSEDEIQQTPTPLADTFVHDAIPMRDLWGATGGAKPMSTEYTETLPSRGVLYRDDEGNQLLPDGRITLRPLTTREEGILYGTADAIEKMHKMVDACIVSRSIKGEDLLSIDQFFILFSLRILSFGAEYDIPIRCRYCSEQAKVKTDLVEQFSVNYMSEAASEPFYTVLPVCGRKVGFRLQRVRDQFRIRQHAKRMRMQTTDPSDPSHTYRLALAIVEMDSQENPGSMVQVNPQQMLPFVQQMHMADSNHLQNEIRRVEGGVDTRIYPDCPNCGATNEMRMPLELEFFRPGAV